MARHERAASRFPEAVQAYTLAVGLAGEAAPAELLEEWALTLHEQDHEGADDALNEAFRQHASGRLCAALARRQMAREEWFEAGDLLREGLVRATQAPRDVAAEALLLEVYADWAWRTGQPAEAALAQSRRAQIELEGGRKDEAVSWVRRAAGAFAHANLLGDALQALEAVAGEVHPEGRVWILQDQAVLLAESLRVHEAEQVLEQALELARAEDLDTAPVLEDQARLALRAGDLERAWEAAREALAVRKPRARPREEVATWELLASIADAAQDEGQSRTLRVRAAAANLGHRRPRWTTLAEAAAAHTQDADAALAYLQALAPLSSPEDYQQALALLQAAMTGPCPGTAARGLTLLDPSAEEDTRRLALLLAVPRLTAVLEQWERRWVADRGEDAPSEARQEAREADPDYQQASGQLDQLVQGFSDWVAQTPAARESLARLAAPVERRHHLHPALGRLRSLARAVDEPALLVFFPQLERGLEVDVQGASTLQQFTVLLAKATESLDNWPYPPPEPDAVKAVLPPGRGLVYSDLSSRAWLALTEDDPEQTSALGPSLLVADLPRIAGRTVLLVYYQDRRVAPASPVGQTPRIQHLRELPRDVVQRWLGRLARERGSADHARENAKLVLRNPSPDPLLRHAELEGAWELLRRGQVSKGPDALALQEARCDFALAQGSWELAREAGELARTLAEDLMGPAAPEALLARARLVACLLQLGELELAARHSRTLLRRASTNPGPQLRCLQAAHLAAGRVSRAAGRHGEAVNHLEQAASLAGAHLGDRALAEALAELGPALRQVGKVAEGLAQQEWGFEALQRAEGPVHADVSRAAADLAQAYAETGDLEAAAKWNAVAEAARLGQRSATPMGVAELLAEARRHRSAEAWAEVQRTASSALPSAERMFGAAEARTIELRELLMEACFRLGDLPGARRLAEAAVAAAEAQAHPLPLAEALNNLGDLLTLDGQPEEAAAHLLRAYELARQAGDPLTAVGARIRLADAWLQLGRRAEAVGLLASARRALAGHDAPELEAAIAEREQLWTPT